MIERLFFLIVAFSVLAGGLWYLSGKYIKQRQANREPREAYFTGGPLNGESRKVKVFSPKYTYEYKKILGAQDHGSFKTYNEENRVAVYDYKSDGMYAYQGSLDAAGSLVKDEADFV